MNRHWLLSGTCWFLVSCASPLVLPTPITSGPGFYDRPFPDDRRRVDGRVDLTGFPHEGEILLLDEYLEEATVLDGFGISSPLTLRVDAPIDTTRLPGPHASILSDSPMFLVDIDSQSPERGERVPLVWEFNEAAHRWRPENLLSVAPVWGRPLRPGTRYAWVLTTDLVSPPPDFEQAWEPGSPDHPLYEPLHEWLFEERIDPANIGYASIFTTQNATQDIAAIVDRMRRGMTTPTIPDGLVQWNLTSDYIAYAGKIRVPWWQHGPPPYSTTGGTFLFSDEGWPLLAWMEELVLALAVPHGPPPEAGWPVVVVIHGTGSGWWTFANGTANDIAGPLARAGIATASISLPFHGDRSVGGGEALLSFNILNPTAGRTNLRQAATEAIWLTDMFVRTPQEATTEIGQTLRFDPKRVAYLGHSHGGVIGSIALPYFHPDVRAAVLSGAGGGLSLSAVGRDAGDFDIQGALDAVVGLDPAEPFNPFHPVVGLLQLVGETTDPLTYARYWFAERPPWPATPRPVLMFEGTQDTYTPPEAIEALAGAAHLALLDDAVQVSGALALPSTTSVATPAEGNQPAWDGCNYTAGLAQTRGGDHFVIFTDPDAQARYVGFLATALEGRAVIP